MKMNQMLEILQLFQKIHFAFCRLMFPQITRHLKIVCCSYERSEYIIFYTSLSKHLSIVYLVKRKSYLFLNHLFYLFLVTPQLCLVLKTK